MIFFSAESVPASASNDTAVMLMSHFPTATEDQGTKVRNLGRIELFLTVGEADLSIKDAYESHVMFISEKYPLKRTQSPRPPQHSMFQNVTPRNTLAHRRPIFFDPPIPGCRIPPRNPFSRHLSLLD
nr:hypothetical protein CFP56_12066 [Quercus suber]